MRQRWSNNAKTILSQSMGPEDTNIVVDNAENFTPLGAGEFEIVTLSTGTTIEIVKVTSRSGADWVVERAQEGTTALNWSPGASVEARVTAGSLQGLSQIEFDPVNIPSIIKSTDDPIREFGPGASVSGSGFSCGNTCSSTNGGLAVGNTSSASFAGSASMGTNATASNTDAVAVGTRISSSGIGSVSVGVDCTSTGENSVSLGVDSDSTALNSVAVGINSQASSDNTVSIGINSSASAVGAVAIGNEAGSYGQHQLNISAIPVAQLPENLGTRDPLIFLSTQPTIFFTEIIDMKTPDLVTTMELPAGMLFYVDEIGFIGRYISNVTQKPQVSIGTDSQVELFLANAEITTILETTRYKFPSPSNTNIGVNMFRIQTTLTAAATEYTGRFYLKGFVVAV